MSRSISPELQARLDSGVTSITTCWRIDRTDGVSLFFTELDSDVLFEGNVYSSTNGYSRTAIENPEGTDHSSVDIEGLLDESGINQVDIASGIYDGADFRLFAIDFLDTSLGFVPLLRGSFGEFTAGESGRWRAELKSLRDAFENNILELTSATCQANLGDTRCKFPLNPPEIARDTSYAEGQYVRVEIAPGTTSEVFGNKIYECITAGTTANAQPGYNTAVNSTTSDGSAEFRCHEAFTRTAVVSLVVDGANFNITVDEPRAVDGWYDQGVLTFESGANAGRSIEIRTWRQSDGRVQCFIPFGVQPNIGDVLSISAGCNKTRDQCRVRFVIPNSRDFSIGNVINMRGFPDLPGQDAVLTYPDAE